MSNNALLRASLEATVPLLIADFVVRGGPSRFRFEWAKEFADELGERGDIILYRGRPGESATMFNRLAWALAISAFVPGGVTFDGMHFVAEATSDTEAVQ